MFRYLPKNPDELKRILRNSVESDQKEFEGGEITSKFEIYEEMNNIQAFSGDFVHDIMLPGHQFNGKKSCGKWKILGCKDHEGGHGFVKKTIQHCNHRGCRTCWVNSVNREARAVRDRIVTFCNLKNNSQIYLNKNRKRLPLHVIVSLPNDKYELMSSIKGRKKARRFVMNNLSKLDVDGGVIFDHPYRFSEDKTSAYFSPHFHCIVTGWIDGMKVSALSSQTGLIVKNTSPLKSPKNIYNLTRYLLSHTGVYMKDLGKRSPEHSVRYFGECQNRKFKVDSVLKYSNDGYDQLDKIIQKRLELSKKINKIRTVIPLQSVVYTHSIIEDNIKESKNYLFIEHIGNNPSKITKALRQFIKPVLNQLKDNPALRESDPKTEFLQIRFDYGNSPIDIVQSEYHTILLDPNLDDLCPECSQKMQSLVPIERPKSDIHYEKIAELVKSLPEDMTVPLDDVSSIFEYRCERPVTYKGLEYFDLDGMMQYDDGIYEKPDGLSSLNPMLHFGIVSDIQIQRFRYEFKSNLGRGMTYDERTDYNNDLKEFIFSMKSDKSAYTKPLECFN